MIRISFSPLLIATMLCSKVWAQESNPAFWLLMPLAMQVSDCAKHGAEMRKHLDDALRAAGDTAPNLLPPDAWEIMRMGLSPSDRKSTPTLTSGDCESAIAMYRHPRFSFHFRQMLAAQFAGMVALRCIVQQPTTASVVKRAWLDAFQRNGFEVAEADLDDSIKTAQDHFKSAGDKPPSVAECEKVDRDLFGAEFDKQYSEAGVYQIFSGKRK